MHPGDLFGCGLGTQGTKGRLDLADRPGIEKRSGDDCGGAVIGGDDGHDQHC